MVYRPTPSRTALFCSVAFLFVLAAQIPEAFGQSSRAPEAIASSALTYKIINADGKGYGYDVYSDGKLLIHQPGIPGMPGSDGFTTRASAAKVAELVVKKLKNRQTPPTVSGDELRRLGVI